MVIGLIRPSGHHVSNDSWRGSAVDAGESDPGSSKDPVRRLSHLLGQATLNAEQQHSLQKCLELAKSEALAAFDWVGFTESLAVCTDQGRAMLRFQERQTCALEAFDTGLAKRYTPIATVSGTQQDQVLQARSQLAAELSAHSGAVLQQVEAAAAAAAARAQSLAPQQCRDQERVAEAALQAFQVQLQLVEDTCTVVDEARQSCKAAITQHLHVFREQYTQHSNSKSSSSSSSSAATLLLKAQLDLHAERVLTVVKHRAAAMQLESQQHNLQPPSQQHEAAGRAPPHHPEGPHPHVALLQQAKQQRACRLATDSDVLARATQQAVQIMDDRIAALKARGFPNAFLAGKAIEEAAAAACEAFSQLAHSQSSYAPDSPEYQQQLGLLEAAVTERREQHLAAMQTAASRTSTAAVAAIEGSGANQ